MKMDKKPVEVLMTYGWIILVLSIIGGAIITTAMENNKDEEEIDTEKVEEFSQYSGNVRIFEYKEMTCITYNNRGIDCEPTDEVGR